MGIPLCNVNLIQCNTYQTLKKSQGIFTRRKLTVIDILFGVEGISLNIFEKRKTFQKLYFRDRCLKGQVIP